MNHKVGEKVRHKMAPRLNVGTVIAVLPSHSNPEHEKPGPWYRIKWDALPHFAAGRLFHGDVLEKVS